MAKQDLTPFCKEAGIQLLILFGSRVTGFAGPSSDLDLAVRFRRGLEVSKLHLLYELDELFHPERVDLVILSPSTPPLLQYEIFLKGRALFEAADGLFEEGRLKAWKLYLDTAPLRKRELEYLREFVRRMRHVT
jgi:predicted nucleotidyltransferase